ncbi:MAG TPA: hypothetical protein VFQ38_01735 [Longimicrobiales bacterium]|nr:hypothetical protein [Longimicrobiales bacterium]
MTFLLLLPVVLSALVLAAHFLRTGNVLALLAVLALLPLLAVRRRWVATVARVILLLGALVWLWTLARFTLERVAVGQPFLRMVAILGGVAAFTALSALVFRTGRLKARYGGAGNAGGAAGAAAPPVGAQK